MSTLADRLAVGHVATASVIGAVGSAGGLGAWWVPVTAVASILAVAAAVVALGSRRRGAGLSRLARALDPRTWEQAAAA